MVLHVGAPELASPRADRPQRPNHDDGGGDDGDDDHDDDDDDDDDTEAFLISSPAKSSSSQRSTAARPNCVAADVVRFKRSPAERPSLKIVFTYQNQRL